MMDKELPGKEVPQI